MTSPAVKPDARARRRRRRLLLAVSLSLMIWGAVGATSTVVPPPSPRDPVTVAIVREGVHLGLLLPCGGGFVEYGVGDWSWDALGNDRWYDLPATVLWPTQATLGRRVHRQPDLAALRAAEPDSEFTGVVVERADVEHLRRQLESAFAAGVADEVRGWPAGTEYVPCGAGCWRSYSLLADCADACAAWLEQLGCSVSWVPVRVDLIATPS
ncbi:MAG: hypothetical protein H6835_16190 [Planctomycetes bacterium]|nr:hypothetical protein [Planctomycetota bacterium]